MRILFIGDVVGRRAWRSGVVSFTADSNSWGLQEPQCVTVLWKLRDVDHARRSPEEVGTDTFSRRFILEPPIDHLHQHR